MLPHPIVVATEAVIERLLDWRSTGRWPDAEGIREQLEPVIANGFGEPGVAGADPAIAEADITLTTWIDAQVGSHAPEELQAAWGSHGLQARRHNRNDGGDVARNRLLDPLSFDAEHASEGQLALIEVYVLLHASGLVVDTDPDDNAIRRRLGAWVRQLHHSRALPEIPAEMMTEGGGA